jgi:threonine/homoserine/homoserine lactone efflux protein
LVTGLGAATADACYGAVAGFGVTVVARLLLAYEFWIALIGGLFLCYLGAKTAIGTPADRPAAIANGHSLAGGYGSALALTLTNPLTILSFAAIFAGLGVGTTASSAGAAALLVAGVLCGSALWWLILTGVVGLARTWLTPGRLRWVNRLSGTILVIFGLAALAGLR